jgi:hypothetical protein
MALTLTRRESPVPRHQGKVDNGAPAGTDLPRFQGIKPVPGAAIQKHRLMPDPGETRRDTGKTARAVTILKLDQERRTVFGNGFPAAVEHALFIPFDIDLDKIHVIEGKIVKPRRFDRKPRRVVARRCRIEAPTQIVKAALAMRGHEQFRLTRLVGQGDVMHRDIADAAARKAMGQLRIGLETFDRLRDTRQLISINAAAGADIDHPPLVTNQLTKTGKLGVAVTANPPGTKPQPQALMRIKHRHAYSLTSHPSGRMPDLRPSLT